MSLLSGPRCGNCYGTLVSEVTSKLASGSSLILEIDVQGALQVKERFEAVLIFTAAFA